MKTKNFLFFAGLLVGGLLNAQEDQTAKATKMGDGPFMSYVINESGGSYTYAGINKEVYTFTFKPYEVDFKEIEIKQAEKTSTDSYYPDEEAFPATYVWGRLNTETCMRGWDYIERREQHRMVILDEWVYILDKWKNKDSYVIEKCFKKGELSGFGLTKKAFGAAKVMENAKHKETLQKYLDEAFKKQGELLPAWQANNKSKIDKRIAAKERYQFTIDSVNGKYWSSAEGQRVLAANKAKENKNSSSTSSGGGKTCFILNDLTQEQMGGKNSVKIGLTSFRLATTFIAKGKTLEVDCDDVIVYRLKNENSSERAPGHDLFPTKGKCGQTIKLSDFW